MSDNPKELYVQTGMEIIDGTATQYVFGDSLSADPSRCFGPKYTRADLAAERIAELEARERELVAKLTRLLRHALPSIEAANERRHPNDPDQKWLMQEIEETLIKIDAGNDKHDWKCTSPGMYDFSYECQRCGAVHCESIDNPASQRPEHGCKLKTGTEEIEPTSPQSERERELVEENRILNAVLEYIKSLVIDETPTKSLVIDETLAKLDEQENDDAPP